MCNDIIAAVSIETFSIQRLYNATVYSKEQSKVYLNGQVTDLLLSGAYLEACLRVYGYYIVIMTHDLPFEQSVLIYLINDHLQVIEHIEIADPDLYDSYTGMEYAAPNHIDLHFARRWILRVSILKNKQISLESYKDKKWVKKQKNFRLQSYFQFEDIEFYDSDDEYW